jgi:hypothetical protein
MKWHQKHPTVYTNQNFLLADGISGNTRYAYLPLYPRTPFYTISFLSVPAPSVMLADKPPSALDIGQSNSHSSRFGSRKDKKTITLSKFMHLGKSGHGGHGQYGTLSS